MNSFFFFSDLLYRILLLVDHFSLKKVEVGRRRRRRSDSRHTNILLFSRLEFLSFLFFLNLSGNTVFGKEQIVEKRKKTEKETAT